MKIENKIYAYNSMKTKRKQIKKNGTRVSKDPTKDPFLSTSSLSKKKMFTLRETEDIRLLCSSYFEENIQTKLAKCAKRPIQNRWGDIVERRKGRIELKLPPDIEKTILHKMQKNKLFTKERKKIHQKMRQFWGQPCKEELCLLPVEPRTKNGAWHRDIFIKSREKDFTGPPFYITQIIYLDEKADTCFCLGSETHPVNNPDIYQKKRIEADTGSSVVFDGRMLHKGLENDTDEIRYAIYIAYSAPFYVDKESNRENILTTNKSLC